MGKNQPQYRVPIRITGNGTFESNYGLLYKWEIEFEDGLIADYNSKGQQQTYFEVGKSIYCSLSEREYQGKVFYKVKPEREDAPNRPQGQPSAPRANNAQGDVQVYIVRQSSIKIAVDLYHSGAIPLTMVASTADAVVDWVFKGSTQDLSDILNVGLMSDPVESSKQ